MGCEKLQMPLHQPRVGPLLGVIEDSAYADEQQN